MTTTSTTNLIPTRMERLHQKKKLHTANHAHKLLEDKYNQLVHTFNDLIKKNRTMRELVEKQLTQVLKLFLSSSLYMTNQALDVALTQYRPEITLSCSTQNIMGLTVPDISANCKTAKQKTLLTTPSNFDQAIHLLQELNNTIIELANIEKTCHLITSEIQKVRRRMNSLEFNMIPDIQGKIKFITMKLDENQRETQIRMLKIKDLQNQK